MQDLLLVKQLEPLRYVSHGLPDFRLRDFGSPFAVGLHQLQDVSSCSVFHHNAESSRWVVIECLLVPDDELP